MPRIIAGVARGRRLVAPPGGATRPTSDRTREGLFSTLAAMYGPLTGARFLDLYAGSGAVGLEALSRGAAYVLLVERDRRAAATITANVRAVGLAGARVRSAGVEGLLVEGPDEPFDVAFVDPPYAMPSSRLAAVLRSLSDTGWLAPGAVAVVERASRDAALGWPEGYQPDRSRTYGEGTLWYARTLHVASAGEPDGDRQSGPRGAARAHQSHDGGRSRPMSRKWRQC